MKTFLFSQIGLQAPEVIRILPLGEVTLGDGRQSFRVTAESLARIMEAWSLRGNDMVIDYEHQTVTGKEAPAAGWVKSLYMAADGLWARVEWTDRAKEYIKKREYRYFSPVVQLGEGRVVLDLLHVALTNSPAITNLVPLVLSGGGNQGLREDRAEGQGVADKRGEKGEVMIIEKLREIFELQDEAPEDEVLTLAADLIREKKQRWPGLSTEILRSLGLREGIAEDEVIERLESLKVEAARAVTFREELTACQRELEHHRAERLIEEALRSRKTTPAELNLGKGRLRRLAQEDPEFFRELILSRQDNWAVPGLIEGSGSYRLLLTEEERQICEAFRITPEEFMKNKISMGKGEK
ncbi:MAG: hypothetical protein FJ135_02205 [Deltaproteobacteria bacterium]|nr:hypothetical protein [Deltaproteobacteria bacterium]